MLSRRHAVLAALSSTVACVPRGLLAALPAHARATGYREFLDAIRSEALGHGFDARIVDRALSLTSEPNASVLKLDRHQPEFTLTWAQYRQRVVTPKRIADGRAAFAARQDLFTRVETHFGVDARMIVGIWGLESAFGIHAGTFHVVDALATLAYDGRRSAFFHNELMKALQILNSGDVSPEHMFGSYAGAMGQPQFMPSAYLRYAVDFNGDGKRDIWSNEADVFASVGNYLARSGWVAGEPWGQAVRVPPTLPQSECNRDIKRSLGQWMAAGVTRVDGKPFGNTDVMGAVIRPDGPGTDAFMVYRNFGAIRRYNPSDFYALGVGLLGYAVA